MSKKYTMYQKQGGCCYYCGILMNFARGIFGEPCDNTATIEHKIPKSRGGNNSSENLVLACNKCNNDKGSMNENEYKRKLFRTGSKNKIRSAGIRSF